MARYILPIANDNSSDRQNIQPSGVRYAKGPRRKTKNTGTALGISHPVPDGGGNQHFTTCQQSGRARQAGTVQAQITVTTFVIYLQLNTARRMLD